MKERLDLTKFRGTKLGVPLKQGRQNSSFLMTHAGHIKIFRVGKYEKKIKFDKILRYENRGSDQTRPSKIQLFYLLSWTHEIFEASNYNRNIIFDKIWVYQNGGSPSNGATKIQTF